MFIDNIEKDLTEKVSAQVRLNQSRGGMCIYVHRGLGWDSRRNPSALDCRMVRQRRLTSSFRPSSPSRKLPTFSCTSVLVPRHRFPVASSLAQPQTASSALKSGL